VGGLPEVGSYEQNSDGCQSAFIAGFDVEVVDVVAVDDS
jgi:hypothetical protein